MTDRAVEIVSFLEQTGWDGATETPLRADFSTRHFARLERENTTPARAILMDAEPDQRTAQFVAIARLLRAQNISAPEIYAENAPEGLALMEDFGDRNTGRLIDAGSDAAPFYRRAIELLVHLHQIVIPGPARHSPETHALEFQPVQRVTGRNPESHFSAPNKKWDSGSNSSTLGASKNLSGMTDNLDLPVFNAALFASQVELFLDAWIPFAKGREANDDERGSFRAAWKQTLKSIDTLPQTLMLRDFMPDNLMELDGRSGWKSVGVLDFQDGGIGPLPYDIASLCEVVRRDNGGLALLNEMIDYYHEQAAPALTKNELRSACCILAAQRHTRILGIIARLALRTGRREKLAYAPRIWAYLDELLRDNALRPIQAWMDEFGPFR